MLSDGTGTTAYTWNAEGKTATVTPYGGTPTTYVYDGDGHRAKPVAQQTFVRWKLCGFARDSSEGPQIFWEAKGRMGDVRFQISNYQPQSLHPSRISGNAERIRATCKYFVG
jgi:YD repeat-containing protein